MRLVVHYYAGARAAAGVEQEAIDLAAGATVAALAAALADRHGAALARVLAASTFLVDEVAGGRERSLDGAHQVDVLPPFAGG
jgi:molybdopterin converting factor small subunit